MRQDVVMNQQWTCHARCASTFFVPDPDTLPSMQFYFETIFPRIPKPVHDDFVSKLIAMGLPSRAVRNGGQGGVDRRGVEEGNRRPASVKASL